MQRVTVGLTGRQYDILIGSGLLHRAGEFVGPLAPTRLLLVASATVDSLYGDAVRRALQGVSKVSTVILPDGEVHKQWPAVASIIDGLVAAGADRKSVLVALGGGVVGDVAGFASAIYMRGIRFIQMPTTLLAQVDSSVGGKTGVNHPTAKNLIGAFHQPALVISDTASLSTLPDRELSAGLAEVLKHGLLADRAYFEATTRDMPALRARDPEALTRAIARSCEIKAGVVQRDERETGERALLNLGHTFGHAIEAMTGYTTWLHGEAVGCGMVLAGDLSSRVGLLPRGELESIKSAVSGAGLPTRIAGLSLERAMKSMRADKKADAGEIRFVLLDRIGHAVQRAVADSALRETLAAGGYV
ncbi:MAG TPA: 3-dehydroquinate synthase [Burkholderiaceae bacterium]|nr:3-dehydroquinate synthase [Burkholderiaceae bacterium]